MFRLRSTAHSLACKLLFEVPLRQRILFVLTLPENCHHPPACSVVHQLNAIDPSLKRFRVSESVARFVGTEDVRNPAKGFEPPCNLLFIKTLLIEERFRSGDVVIDAQNARTITACLSWIGRNQTSARHQQGPHPIPVPLLSRRPAEHVLNRGKDCVNGTANSRTASRKC